MSSDPADPKEALRRFQQRVLWDFAKGFDKWAVKVIPKPVLRTGRRPAEETFTLTGTLGDLARNQWRSTESNDADLVWELATLCSNYVTGDLWAWGIYWKSTGFSDEGLARALYVRMKLSLAETYCWRWSAGLGVLDGTGYRGFFTDWRDEAWKDVAEFTDVFAQKSLLPYLSAPLVESKRRPDSGPRAATNKAMTVDFIERILIETGHRITREDIGGIAGYSGKTEVQRFQRNSPRLSAGVERRILAVLRLSSEDAVARVRAVRSRRRAIVSDTK
jgi:hypothetical protein